MRRAGKNEAVTQWRFCRKRHAAQRIGETIAETAPNPHTAIRQWHCGHQGRPNTAQLAEQFDVHPNKITSWKAQLEGGAANVFGPGGGGATQPAVDVKSLHAKIGELTLENDFLEGALSKAGLLSARR